MGNFGEFFPDSSAVFGLMSYNDPCNVSPWKYGFYEALLRETNGLSALNKTLSPGGEGTLAWG